MVVTSRLSGSRFCGFRTTLKDCKLAPAKRLLCAHEITLRGSKKKYLEEFRSAELYLNERSSAFPNQSGTRRFPPSAIAGNLQNFSQCKTSLSERFSIVTVSAGYPTGIKQISLYPSGAPISSRIRSA